MFLLLFLFLLILFLFSFFFWIGVRGVVDFSFRDMLFTSSSLVYGFQGIKFFSGKKTPHFFSYIHAPYTRFKSVWWHMLKLVIANQWLIQHFCENCVLNTGFGVSYSFRVKMFVKYLIHTWTRVPIKEVGLFEPRWYSLIGLSSMYPYTKHVI